LFTSDLLAHIYKGYGEGRFDEHHPVFFLCDEVQNMATRQLCDALDEGRGIGLHCILAHQHLAQLALEDQSGYLLHSVMTDARTKVIFGDLPYEDLEVLTKNVMIDRYSPWPTPAQLGKTARLMTTKTRTHSKGRGMAWPTSETEGESESTSAGTNRSSTHGIEESTSEAQTTGRSRGRSLTHGEAHTTATGSAHTTSKGYARSSTESSSHMSGRGDARGTVDASSSGTMAAQGSGMTMFYDNPDAAMFPNAMTASTHQGTSAGAHESRATHTAENSFTADGMSHSEAETTSDSEANTHSESRADTFSFSEGTNETASEASTHGRGRGRSYAETEGDSNTTTSGTNYSCTKGVTPSTSEGWSDGMSASIQPLSPEEQTLLAIQRMKAIRKAHFLLKAPEAPACIIQAPWVEVPKITRNELESGMARVYALPFYTHRDASVIEVEAQEIVTPQQKTFPRLPDPEHTPPAASTPPVGPTTFRRKRRASEA
jgi:hypothetical protein